MWVSGFLLTFDRKQAKVAVPVDLYGDLVDSMDAKTIESSLCAIG